MQMKPGDKYAVFSIREMEGGSVWTRAGVAFVNRDGSVNLRLDVLPLDGKLHVREFPKDGTRPQKPADAQPMQQQSNTNNTHAVTPMDAAASMGGH